MTSLQTVTMRAVLAAAIAVLPFPAAAQYFGQNKVQHHVFDFQVLQTEHFDIYYYPEEAEVSRQIGRLAERWYTRLSRVFNHDLSGRQPLILYASHPHFEQTNAISGLIGEGTGGVTESFKRRIVMPIANGLGDTNHVLGHELVHAFQYDLLGPRMSLPGWFIEGMAEYLSLGSDDALTAVWVRDAGLREELPSLEDLNDPKYFPYRWGHALWAYIGGRWGDAAIPEALYEAGGVRSAAAETGGDPIGAIERVTGLDHEAFTEQWHDSIAQTMIRPLGEQPTETGRALIEPARDRELNVGPAVSPDGRRIAYLSSRDLLSIDVYVADAQSGAVQRKLTSTAADPHYDSLQFIASAGAWAPDSRRLAITTVRAGRPVLAIFDAIDGGRLDEMPLDGIDEAFNPAWSPDGRSIAFSGLAGGQSDLFLLDVDSGKVSHLTDDLYADMEPDWSPDGTRLLFVTDRFDTDLDTLDVGLPELGVITIGDRSITRLSAFSGVRHLSPQWGADGRTVYFIAAPEGIPNVYRRAPDGDLAAMTRVPTGVTGITEMSPALSVSGPDDRVVFVAYHDSGYLIRSSDHGTVPALSYAGFDGAQLAPATRQGDTVDALIARPDLGLPAQAPADSEPYDPGLSLDYIGQEFGVATVSQLGAYVGGGIAMRFSDMLGRHMVSGIAQVNGSFKDIAGQVGYLNRTHRWNWGGFFSRQPYVTGFVSSGIEPVQGQDAIVERVVRDRQIEQGVSAVTEYPFSRATRLEIDASLTHLTFDREITERAYDPVTGAQLTQDTTNRQLARPVTLGGTSVALVRDTSVFGATGPIVGHRSRLELAPTFGGLRFTTAVADVRQYWMPFQPVTLAARVLHVGRYGGDSDSVRLSPLYVGFPNLVRGYGVGSFDATDCGGLTADGRCGAIDDLVGSRLLVTGVEVRAPLVGLFKGELDYGPIPIDLVGFFDAGVAWDGQSSPQHFGGDRPWARSAGAGLRINAFGYVVVELDAVRPFDRVDNGWRFAFAIRPGF
ncbi:MAG: BamA/TamA family outer membrane protein [Vicinamibacterales bacterium]